MSEGNRCVLRRRFGVRCYQRENILIVRELTEASCSEGPGRILNDGDKERGTPSWHASMARILRASIVDNQSEARLPAGWRDREAPCRSSAQRPGRMA